MKRDDLLSRENEFLRKLVDSLMAMNERLMNQLTPSHPDSSIPQEIVSFKGFESHLSQIAGSEDEEEVGIKQS